MTYSFSFLVLYVLRPVQQKTHAQGSLCMSLILSGHIGRFRAGMTVCLAAPEALRNYSLIHQAIFYPPRHRLSSGNTSLFTKTFHFSVWAAHSLSKYL